MEDALRSSKFVGMALFVVALTVVGCARDAGAPAERASNARSSDAATDTTQLVPVTPAELAAIVKSGGAQATLVNVWATWCQPCREEFPDLVRLSATREATCAEMSSRSLMPSGAAHTALVSANPFGPAGDHSGWPSVLRPPR